jgi:WD40 repeat protein
MIRWASCGLVMLLAAQVGVAQTKDVISELTGVGPPVKLRPNPFGGAPLPVADVQAAQQMAQQLAQQIAQLKIAAPAVPPPANADSSVPPPGAPRVIRPVFTLPGAPKLDRHGDPLPAGAIARFGTVRLRHGTEVHAMGFTHDGKHLCTVSGSEDSIKLWDVVTGKEVARLNSPASLIGLARNGSVVIVDDTRVRVWLPLPNTVRDLPEKTLPEGSSPTALAVNPDGHSFALATDSKVLLIDLQSGKTLKELNLPGNPPVKPVPGGLVPAPPPPPPPAGPPTPPPAKLMYSPDGRWLVGNGQKTGVWLWDLRTGKRVRTYRTEADFPEYSFSPDVTRIAITGERVHLYALDSEEPVEGFRGPENVPCFAPRYSADGKLLFVVLGDASVQPLDATTGEQKDALDAPDMNLHAPFALAAGGVLAAALDQAGGIRIWDPQTGKGPEVTRLPTLTDPGFATGGRSVLVLDANNKIHSFALTTGEPGKVIELPVEENGVPATLDAVYRRAGVFVPGGEELELQILDVDTGKVVSKHPIADANGVPFISFASANRERMALITQTGVVVLNPTTGKAVRSFIASSDNGLHGAISPDGRVVAITSRPLTVWEVATGKKRLTIDALPNADQVAFSPDSRSLAAWDQAGNAVVVDLRSGTVSRRINGPDASEGVTALAFSPDGKRLAAGSLLGRVTIWDVVSGDTLAPFGGHDGAVTGLVFSADGKHLVSTALDGTALVWVVPDKPLSLAPVEAPVTGFDEAFRLLGAGDPVQAQRGFDYLYRNPAEAVKQAAERIPALTAVPAAKLAQLVADLESEDYPTRDAAMRELEKAGGEASALLKHAVTKSPSAEVRKLAAELLGKIDSPAVRPEDLKVLRAVEALEHIGTPAARTQLEKWAAGPAGHRLTAEAAAAIARSKPGDK